MTIKFDFKFNNILNKINCIIYYKFSYNNKDFSTF